MSGEVEVYENSVLVCETGGDLWFHKRMMCFVERIEYDFRAKTGRVYMPSASCTDYTGCIETFKAIDPDVGLIETFSAGERDTLYVKRSGKWLSSLPGRKA